MSVKGPCWHLAYRSQRGAFVLLTVLLLLLMLTLVTLYTGRIQSFQHKILLNEQDRMFAITAAQRGLEQAIATLISHKYWPASGLDKADSDNRFYGVDAQTKHMDTASGPRAIVTLTVTGSSADTLVSAQITESLLIYPLITHLPKAPLVVAGGFASEGSFEIVANPNGRGQGLPLSVWSKALVTLKDTASYSCLLKAYELGRCQLDSLSQGAFKGPDLLDNAVDFPSDLLAHFLDLQGPSLQNLHQQAKFELTDCDALTVAGSAVIWVTGDCEIAARQQIASAAEPVVLVVMGGKIVFQAGAQLFGLLIWPESPDASPGLSITMHTGAHIHGALITHHQLGQSADTLSVIFNGEVYQALKKHPEFLRVARLSGSWSNF
jgi:hypothetical protein